VESIAPKIGCVPQTLLDRVNRRFTANCPNQLWVSDFTYVSTWQGWLYVAFVVDVFARRIVGWRVSTTMATAFALDELEQALYDRQPDPEDALPESFNRLRNAENSKPGTVLAEPFPGTAVQRDVLFGDACDRFCLLCYLKADIPQLAGEWWPRA
jgi:transposase InsO family protein